MRAGDLDRRVELRHRTLTENTQGEQEPSWPSAYATVWASRRDVTAREKFAAQQVQGELDAIFEIRYRADVLPTDRLICEGRTYNVRPGREIGRRQGLELIATVVL